MVGNIGHQESLLVSGGGEVTIDRREVVLGLGGGCQSTRDLVDPPLCGADQVTALVGCSRGGALGVSCCLERQVVTGGPVERCLELACRGVQIPGSA